MYLLQDASVFFASGTSLRRDVPPAGRLSAGGDVPSERRKNSNEINHLAPDETSRRRDVPPERRPAKAPKDSPRAGTSRRRDVKIPMKSVT